MKRIGIILLTLSIILTGCAAPKNFPVAPALTESEAFNDFLSELLVSIFDSTDIGINFSFVHPENYDIEPGLYQLGFTNKEDYEVGFSDSAEIINILNSFNDQELTQQQFYDKEALLAIFKNSNKMADYYDFQTGSSYLGFARSTSVNLPALLEVYEFRNQHDIDAYFNFLETLPEDVRAYTDLEKERQQRNTGYGQEEIDEIIRVSDITATSAKQDDYYLLRVFNDKIDALDFVSTEAKETAKADNKRLIQGPYAESYQIIVDELATIQAPESLGLAHKENGKAYYEVALQNATGIDKSVKEISAEVDRELGKIAQDLFMYSDSDEMFNRMISYDYGNYNSAQEVLDMIAERSKLNFPEIPPVPYQLNKVDDSMSEGSSPAFYFTPHADATTEEVQNIFVNGDFNPQNYTMYAHEGLPGHMYQFNYFLGLTEMHPIRNVLSNSGNAEGWANYAEKEAIYYTTDDLDLANFMVLYERLLEMMYIKMDIGIHYDGWTLAEFKDFMLEMYDMDDETLKEIYVMLVHTPAAYPTYYLSSHYIYKEKERVLRALGEDFDEKVFHKVILDAGSAPMEVVIKHVDRYLEEK